MQIYDKPVRQLMFDMIDEFNLGEDKKFKREQAVQWFAENYPKIKKATITAHLMRLTTNANSRIHHNPIPGEDDKLFQLSSDEFRKYQPEKDPAPVYQSDIPEQNEVEAEDQSASEFAYESDLKNYLSKNLSTIESGLSLYEEEGIKGIEFPVGKRYIDLLAIDSNEDYVVIELKVSKGYDRVIGQLLRYTAWIKQNLANEGQSVRGIIIARSISEDLILACSQVKDVELYEYDLSIKLNKINQY